MDLKLMSLGIELGSTRIKAVLIDERFEPVASGSHDWENRLTDGYWTYSLEDVWAGIRDAYKKLADAFFDKYNEKLTTAGGIGISAMMHGYLAFDRSGKLLTPFRTWRNTTTARAAALLTEKLSFNIPQRWSAAHLAEAILNGEAHVKDIDFITTLAGYIHWKLTGEKVLGVGDASGMFPVDSDTNNYDGRMLAQFDGLFEDKKYPWKIAGILPKSLCAGESAGTLTEEGAELLDPAGNLKAGIPLCPPEGDAGTGMTATNSVAAKTGNVSAGTSIFAMIVLEKRLSKLYPEIDMVTTPAGKAVAMVHCNNCTSDLDAWIRLFGEVNALFRTEISKPELYDALYKIALNGDPDCGGLLSFNYYSGEPITGLCEGRPLFVRTPDSEFNLANFMRNTLFSAMATLKIGMELLESENVLIERLAGHGGLFKTEGVGQALMAAALDTPVSVTASAGEGGAWGIAILAAYLNRKDGKTLEEFLECDVFAGKAGSAVNPAPKDIDGFKIYLERYKAGLEIERSAVEVT